MEREEGGVLSKPVDDELTVPPFLMFAYS